MNRVIPFFSYELCYQHYTKRITNIRQAKIKGETILAKPVLILSVIDGIDANIFTNNQFAINNWVQDRYNMLMKEYAKDTQFDVPTGIEKPFWHLESDGFWHLNYQGERLGKSSTPSMAWLKENVEYAYFDESLWIMLQNKVWRMKLRDFIIEQKLTGSFWNAKIAAEGLGIFAAILLAV